MQNGNEQRYQIFISYRRNGSDAHARVFYEKFKELGYSVFLDFESLFSGGFKVNILKAIEECSDFLLLLPKDGLARCSEEDDLLREEIATAIRFKKNIIPVFISGFKMPLPSELPPDIAELVERNGVDCSMEYFDAVFEKIVRNLDSQPQDNELYQTLARLRDRVLGLRHDYFKKWVCMKVNGFLFENDDFFDGTNRTNPHAEDTFGISGISFTKKSIKAITAVSDYWNDHFTVEYLKQQARLIEKGVKITRIFVIEKGGLEAARPQMEYQKKMGIHVCYIEKGNEFIDPEWLLEDYLIQDDELLVQIFCQTHQFESQTKNTEMITMDTVKVGHKIERFQRILERANYFELG